MTTQTLNHPVTEKVTNSRPVERVVTGQATSDGAGVKLTRVLTQPLQRRLDPFLMLDAFGTDPPSASVRGVPAPPAGLLSGRRCLAGTAPGHAGPPGHTRRRPRPRRPSRGHRGPPLSSRFAARGKPAR